MSYLQDLMNAEREFRKLAETKLRQSLKPILTKSQRKKLFWEHQKAIAEAISYKEEIEVKAEIHFPIHLEIELQEILQSKAL